MLTYRNILFPFFLCAVLCVCVRACRLWGAVVWHKADRPNFPASVLAELRRHVHLAEPFAHLPQQQEAWLHLLGKTHTHTTRDTSHTLIHARLFNHEAPLQQLSDISQRHPPVFHDTRIQRYKEFFIMCLVCVGETHTEPPLFLPALTSSWTQAKSRRPTFSAIFTLIHPLFHSSFLYDTLSSAAAKLSFSLAKRTG